ncbi:hypothetical protein [Solitalea canadensis]|uniref:Outer membrane protein beta-barrel domain-containing protein n=1 Tax=Solitalea canadensis (strain ATCC 29591 / DSM 3403 / JCM 21819 / LMG 8368 / NBRC 15130 / NCIMB 12057 / USAM 9D) TaxID=929556 RepID=H8KSJ3_SOLCM|nr:hypothetical protein [Solitalea canadensis]AFD08544.1 hypothetical protein Solca_3540 [Solitalea canadensis DSM 3403]
MKEFKNLDELFKEGLGSAEDRIAFNESDWDKLERRLDKKKNRIPVMWLATAGGIAAILALVFVWMQFESSSLTKPAQDITKKVSPEQKNSIIQQGRKDKFDHKEDIKVVQQDAIPAQNQIEVAKSTPNKIQGFPLADNVFSKSDNPTVLSPINNGGVSQRKVAGMPLIDTAKLTGNLSRSIAQVNANQKRNPYLGKLTFSVGAAPALNGVNTLKGGDWGGDLGMALTIGLSKKWSVTTGVIYAKKVYSTGYENYNPVNPPPVSYSPTSIDADCRVLDIPLNINYQLFSKKQNTVKLSTGLSSYMMLKEDYYFNYSYSNPSYPEKYEVNNENKHWLGVVNASVEYQRKINSTMSIGIQPFVKIPLDGVGYSRVKLKTAGVAVKLNIDLGKGKKKEQ